jgi:hypothetical protein
MEPNPTEVSPWYLRNITQALALDETTGNVYVRTNTSIDIGNANISIGNVGINSFGNIPITGNTLPVTVTGGNVNAAVTGTVAVSAITGNLAGITGNVTVVDGGGSITVDGTVGVSGTVNANITGGNVNAAVTGTVAVSAISSNVTVVDGGGSLTVDGTVGISGNVNIGTMPNVNASISGGNVNVNAFNDGLVDAFGRLRVSNPVTLFDTQARYYDHKQYSTSATGNASVTYESDSSSFRCNVGTASGDSVLRETVKTFPYQPGKSLLVYQSFCFNALKANLRQRVGYFGAQNGIFFEANGTTLNMVIRSYSSGGIVEDRIPQSQWNTNSMSNSVGTNPCGITLNPALVNIWFCDIEWLGVGTVRVGFIINGQYITCHTFHHANTASTGTADNTTTYMTTATLPLRLEITNTGATASASMLRQICSSVISEGGFQLSGSGNPRAASHLIGAPVRLPNDSSFKPVMSIRLKSTNLDAVVIPINYSLVPVSQSVFQYRVYKKAITTGGSWVSSAADSSVEYNLTPTALVSGDIAEQTFINSSNQSASAPTQESFTFTYQLEREPFTGVAYEYVIMMATLGTNQDVYASVEWQEIS